MSATTGARRIVRTRDVICGQPRVDGTRIGVWLIVECFRGGWSVDEIVSNYPSLTRDDVEGAIRWFMSRRAAERRRIMRR